MALPQLDVEPRTTLKAKLEAFERQLIETALAATEGNQRQAAARLGLLPTTLHEKMKRLGLVRRADEGGNAPQSNSRRGAACSGPVRPDTISARA